MERGDVARLLNVAEADIEAFADTEDGLFVDVRDAGRRVVTDDGVFGCDDHRANRQLRRWGGPVIDPSGAAVEPMADEATEEPDTEEPAAVVPEGTAEQVLEWVDGDPVRATQALAAEQQRGKPRATLIAAMKKLGIKATEAVINGKPTFSEIQDAVTDALKARLRTVSGADYVWAWVCDMTDTDVVYQAGTDDDLYQCTYAIGADGAVTLGDPVQWVRAHAPAPPMETNEPDDARDPCDSGMPMAEAQRDRI